MKKRCTRCGLVKPLSGFHRRGASADGLRAQCKVCNIEQVTAWNRQHPHKLREYQRTFRTKQHREGVQAPVRTGDTHSNVALTLKG